MMKEMYCLIAAPYGVTGGICDAGMNSGASVARSTGLVAGGFDVKRG
jgi:hypothetical protein